MSPSKTPYNVRLKIYRKRCHRSYRLDNPALRNCNDTHFKGVIANLDLAPVYRAKSIPDNDTNIKGVTPDIRINSLCYGTYRSV